MKKSFLLICFLYSLSATAQTQSFFDCGLTYIYDAAGNRIIRMIVPCGDPSGKTLDSAQAASDTKRPNTDSTTLATFQIVMIAPNPTSGPVSISCNQDLNNANVKVVDINGQIVSQFTANGRNIQMDISHLVPGSYTAVVTSNGNATAKTLIKTSH